MAILRSEPRTLTPLPEKVFASVPSMWRLFVPRLGASLMTGRYYYRTGVTDTYIGRAMMHGDEVTLAEMLVVSGYSTGIFGKWHLGDNYPMRPIDQGFQEALVHRGGGIGQPADPPGNDWKLRSRRETKP